MKSLIEKDGTVIVDKDIFKQLGADFLLHVRGFNLCDYLTNDIHLLARRNAMFEDIINMQGLRELLVDTLSKLNHIAQILRMKEELLEKDRALYSVKQLELYFEIVDSLSEYYKNNEKNFESQDFVDWFREAYLQQEKQDYIYLKKGCSKLLEKITAVKSISIGFNFDATLSPIEAGILSVNSDYIRSGSLIDRILRFQPGEPQELLSMAPLVNVNKSVTTKEVSTLNMSLYSALNSLFYKTICGWNKEISIYMKEHLSALLSYSPDISFLIEVSGIIIKMKKAGLTFSNPVYKPINERAFKVKQLYNPVLAYRLFESDTLSTLVKNDLVFDQTGGIYLLTGANNGGKSVFLCAVALCLVFGQLGLPVPAQEFEFSPVESIFVFFPKFESLNIMGRLAEECSSIQRIFKNMHCNGFVFFDELFSSTDPNEGMSLLREIIEALAICGARGIIATHLYSVFDSAMRINNNHPKSLIDHLAINTSSSDGTRTYKIDRRLPDFNSYAYTIAEKYGILTNTLVELVNNNN